MNERNKLSKLVTDLNLNAQTAWLQKIELFSINRFPKLSINDLKLYGCRSYQVKLAPYYFFDHLSKENDFEFKIAKDASNIYFNSYKIDLNSKDALLLKIHIGSRHSSRRKYFAYVLIDKSQEKLKAILGHCCGCIVGKRVIGCCSHVMTILWYFGYAQYKKLEQIAPDHLQILKSLCDIDSDDSTEIKHIQ